MLGQPLDKPAPRCIVGGLIVGNHLGAGYVLKKHLYDAK